MPDEEMREAMARARGGDDVYGEDPTVNELQEQAAQIVGKEAALFVPSGTMGNQVALLVHTGRGEEVIVEIRLKAQFIGVVLKRVTLIDKSAGFGL